jgi:hypothetical protein
MLNAGESFDIDWLVIRLDNLKHPRLYRTSQGTWADEALVK